MKWYLHLLRVTLSVGHYVVAMLMRAETSIYLLWHMVETMGRNTITWHGLTIILRENSFPLRPLMRSW